MWEYAVFTVRRNGAVVDEFFERQFQASIRWEHETNDVAMTNQDDIADELNRMGGDGWELVSVTQEEKLPGEIGLPPTGYWSRREYIFKKPNEQ